MIMTEETWGNNDNYTYDEPAIQTGIMINGTVLPIEPGMSFKDAVKEASLSAGFGKFRVIYNGVEIKPSEAPAVFNTGDIVEIRAYDAAG